MYAKITNGAVDQYPYTIGNLRRDNPQTSFPKRLSNELLSAWGVERVEDQEPPAYDERTQRIVREEIPTLVDSSWVLKWTVYGKTAEEIEEYDLGAASGVRAQRDKLLAETDWIVIMHTEKGTNIPAAWEIYRQSLRDITSQPGFPHNVTWPEKPAS